MLGFLKTQISPKRKQDSVCSCRKMHFFFNVKNCSYTACQSDFFVIATDLQL